MPSSAQIIGLEAHIMRRWQRKLPGVGLRYGFRPSAFKLLQAFRSTPARWGRGTGTKRRQAQGALEPLGSLLWGVLEEFSEAKRSIKEAG
jgi:hypothetical protein